VRKLEDKFQGIKLHHIPRRDNDAADFLAKLAARRDPSPGGIFVNDIHEPSARIIEGPTRTHPDAQPMLGGSDPDAQPAPGGFDPSTSTSPANVAVLALDQTDWRVPLLAYLPKEVLPPERTEARQIARHAKTFIVLGNKLYKWSRSGVLIKCVLASRGKQILLEVHARIYGHHAALRSLVRKTFRQGFYWPTALRDAEEVIRRCE